MLAPALAGAGILIISLLVPQTASAAHGQFCWAVGSYDRTVYFASIEDREDRSRSFHDLLYISGIEFTACRCVLQDLADHRSFRSEMVESWRRAELEVVDTNFLSDLDY